MKILHDVPEILTPSMVMDAALNWHITFPLLDSRDFLMYGKTMILNESSTLNENISNCLLFIMEMVYALEMSKYGIKEFWDDTVLKGAMRSAAPIIGGKAWRYDLLSFVASDYRFHLSNTIWRRKLIYKDDGVITPIEVYPDKETIPAHNISQFMGKEREVYLSKDIADKAGYPTLKNRNIDYIRTYKTFFYYSPLPRLKMESKPNTADFYIEFYDKCDRSIYKWIERLMSAMMLRSADSVFAARDMAAVSYLEKWPDESAFPQGDVFMVQNTDPVKKLINILNALPEGALYPNPGIWAASSCERYPIKDAEEQINNAAAEIPPLTETDYEKTVREAVTSGSIAGMGPRAARIVDQINSNPDAIDLQKAELLKDCVAEEETRLLQDAGMDGEWEIDRDTARIVKKQAAVFISKEAEKTKSDPADQPVSSENKPANKEDKDPKIENILESAFVDTEMLTKEEIIRRAFLDLPPDQIRKPEKKNLPKPEKKESEWPELRHSKTGGNTLKKEAGTKSYLDNLLDSAFLDKE